MAHAKNRLLPPFNVKRAVKEPLLLGLFDILHGLLVVVPVLCFSESVEER
jgi:hypothetical protein